MINQLDSYISDKAKAKIMFKAFGLLKVPLIFFTGANVSHIDAQSCHVDMPFSRRNKNHWGSLYFGALAIGADACIGMLASYKIYQRKEKISLVFKSFEAEFLKRAMGKTRFICEEGTTIDELIDQAIKSGERVHKKIKAIAVVQDETVAEFVLELSLKKKS